MSITGPKIVLNNGIIPKIISVDTIHENTLNNGITVKDELSMNSNKIINLATPTNSTDAANKDYVDSIATAGTDAKISVIAATTVAGTLATDFENGDTIDDVVLSTGDRILIKNQASGVENGIYLVNATGAPTRSSDFDTGDSVASAFLFVQQGTVNADIGYLCTNNTGSDVVGTDSLSFSQFSESTTASNQGVGGVGVFIQKTGVDLEFKNINVGSNKLSVTDDAVNDEIDLDVVEANLTLDNIGGTLSVSKGGTGATTLTSGNFLQGNGTSAVTATKAVPTGDVVGTTDTQTLTNKTLTSMSANNTVISDVATPVSGTDAANKNYVDGLVGGSMDFKNSVRVATTIAGTLATSFENGDTVDGITLATGNRILIKDQASGAENGIYTVNATGAPTRTTDLDTGDSAASVIVYTEEGNVNGDKGFICTNNSGSDTVGTNALTFVRTANSNIPIRVSNFTELSAAVTAGETYIYLNAGTYTFTSTITLASNTILCGSGQNSTIFTPTGALGTNLITTGANDNIIIKDIQFDGNSEASVNLIALGNGTTNVRIYDCTFTGNAGSTDAIDATGSGSGVSNIWIERCNFDTITGNGISQTAGDTYSTWFVNNCSFISVTANPIDLNSLTRTFNIQGCIFNTCGAIDLQGDSINFNDNIVIALTSPITVNDGKINITGNTIRTFTVDCIEIANVSTIDLVNITSNVFYGYSANGIDVQCATATACRINIEGNTFESPSGSAVAINVADQVAEGGSTGGTVLITGNMIETTSTGEGNIVVSPTGNPFVNVGNNGLHQTESYTGAVTLSGYSDELLVTTTGITTATLPDIEVGSKGHRLYIELDANGGNLTVTPTSAKNFTSVTFDTAGQYVVLEWTGIQWELLDVVNNPIVNDFCHEVTTITEFENAITMVGNSSNGGSIKILGSITVSASVTVPSNCMIFGCGPNVSTLAGSNLLGGILETSTNDNITIKDLRINVAQTASLTIGVNVESGAERVIIDNCHFTNLSSVTGTSITDAGAYTIITNCRFYGIESGITTTGNALVPNCLFDTLLLPYTNGTGSDMKISGCVFDTCGPITVEAIRTTITNNSIVDATGDAIELTNAAADYSIISNNTIENTTTNAIDISSTPENVTVTGNTINTATIGIVTAGNYTSIVGNTIRATSTAGISVTTSGEFFTITGNTLNNCDVDGIDINTAANGEVSGNTVDGSTDGIDVSSPGALLKIGNNNIEEAVTDPATIDGYTDRVLVTTGVGNISATLGNLTAGSAGHRIYIELDVDGGGNLTITPTNAYNFTSVVMGTAGQYIIVEWNGVQWELKELSGNPTINDYEFVVNTLTELTNAITMVGNAAAGGSIKVLGSITITSTLTVPSNCTIYGLGPNITALTGDDIGPLLDVSTNDNVTIKDIEFNVTYTGTITYGIQVSSGGTNVHIDNCHFTGATGIGINNGGSNIIVTNCTFHNIVAGCLSNSDITFSNCYFDTITTALNMSGARSKIDNCHFTTCTTISLSAANITFTNNTLTSCTNGVDVNGANCDFCVVSGNTIDTTTNTAINVDTSENVSIAGNTIDTAGTGIATNGNYTSIVGNTIKDTTTAGISVGTSGEFFSIVGNTLNNCDADGIDINTAANGEVSGNTVSGSTDGIDVSTPGALLKIGSNNIEEAVSDPATLDGYTDRILVTTTTATGSTLGDLNAGSTGHRVYIELDVDVGDLTITPTSFANGTSIVLDDAGDYIILEWDGDDWHLVDNQSGNTVTQTITVGTTTNLDSNPTVGNQQITRIGNIVTFSATFQCNPTASATTTSFRVTLPDALTFSATAATANLQCTSNVTGYYDTTTPTPLSNEFAVPVVSTSQLLISFTSSGTADDHFINLITRYSTV